MKRHDVRISKRASKEVEALDPQVSKKILRKIWELAENPRPPGCKKLVGYEYMWRIRVGDYRVLYTIDDAGAIVAMVVHRGGAYR